MKNPILSFTVKLSKWRCGGEETEDTTYIKGEEKKQHSLGKGETSLLNEQGFRCCLGFACTSGGYKRKLTDMGQPSDLTYAIAGLSKVVKDDPTDTIESGALCDTKFTHEAITINDNIHTSIAVKMKKLTQLGKKHGIEVKFVP